MGDTHIYFFSLSLYRYLLLSSSPSLTFERGKKTTITATQPTDSICLSPSPSSLILLSPLLPSHLEPEMSSAAAAAAAACSRRPL